MGMREELMKDALEEFVDRLPDHINNTEAAWIIFNILLSREKLDNWEKINRLTIANIGEYFIHQAFSIEELAETEAKMFLDKVVKEHKAK
tara:strand:- start:1566 stop:1835 length:270 start_codon:yes stop_codon:yes gene_type:complete